MVNNITAKVNQGNDLLTTYLARETKQAVLTDITNRAFTDVLDSVYINFATSNNFNPKASGVGLGFGLVAGVHFFEGLIEASAGYSRVKKNGLELGGAAKFLSSTGDIMTGIGFIGAASGQISIPLVISGICISNLGAIINTVLYNNR